MMVADLSPMKLSQLLMLNLVVAVVLLLHSM
jgi:hypothetical protein